MKKNKPYYWQTHELVLIGTFTALIKVISFLVAITGGGMNPVSMIVKNFISTSLLVILVFSVRKFGVFTLYVAVAGCISMITMGRGLMITPGLLIAGFACDFIIVLLGGYKSNLAVLCGVALFDISYRSISLGIGYLFTRENPQLMLFAVVTVAIGYLGALGGLYGGKRFAEELKHAGIIKE